MRHIIVGTMFGAFLVPNLAGCGKEVHVTRNKPICTATHFTNLTNCSTPGPAPTATPTPVGVVLTVQAPLPAPSGSGWLNTGYARLPSATPNTWQAFGPSNASTPTTRTFATNMTVSGQCTLVTLRVDTTAGAPASYQGTFYNSASAWKFQYCLDNGAVLAKYEDGGDSNYNDYTFRITANGGFGLTYQMVAGGVMVCLD